MNRFFSLRAWLMSCGAIVAGAAPAFSTEVDPFGRGPYAVGSTNMEVADEYAGIGDEAMGEYLSGRADEPLTKAVLDSVLSSEEFGPRLDPDNIGISGHSLGGFTALALAGGRFQGNVATIRDGRIKAGVIAAPWVGGRYDGSDFFAFGPSNRELNRVTAPMLCLFGTKDRDTLASFILPAMRHLSGPTYVVELVDQPHVFEQGSWEDRDNWELLFFSAYLKNDPAALRLLQIARSMKGGNEDVQLLDYQRLAAKAARPHR